MDTKQEEKAGEVSCDKDSHCDGTPTLRSNHSELTVADVSLKHGFAFFLAGQRTPRQLYGGD